MAPATKQALLASFNLSLVREQIDSYWDIILTCARNCFHTFQKLKKKIENLREQLQKSQTENSTWGGEKNNLKKEIDDNLKKKMNNQMDKQIDNLKIDDNVKKEIYENLKKEIYDNLKKEIGDNLKKKIYNLKKEIDDNLKMEIDNLKKEIGDNQTKDLENMKRYIIQQNDNLWETINKGSFL
jgi:regulator of replication initiation timing